MFVTLFAHLPGSWNPSRLSLEPISTLLKRDGAGSGLAWIVRSSSTVR
jgi:hypothetical protein